MAFCDSTCAVALPAGYGGCKPEMKAGGIKRLVFKKCSYDFTDITDDAEWQTAIDAGDVVITGDLMAEEQRGSFTRTRIAANLPEAVTGKTKAVSFTDYNVDPDWNAVSPTNKDISFYNSVVLNNLSYSFAYIDCDNVLYGFVDQYVAEIDRVIPNNNNEMQSYQGTVEYNGLAILTRTPLGFNPSILTP